jgi:hypothetical protein
MKKIYIAILALLISTSAFAQSGPKFGLGWYSMSAPVGGRLWVSPVIGIDLGLGYADKKLLGADNDRFHLNAGIVFNAVKAGDANFFIRPGIELQSNGRTVGSETKSKLIVTADLGVEWFVSEQILLSVGHGYSRTIK